MGHFQVKSMFFEVAQHFFNPHPPAIGTHHGGWGDQISRQQPGDGLSGWSVEYQMGRGWTGLGEQHVFKQARLAHAQRQTIQALPVWGQTR